MDSASPTLTAGSHDELDILSSKIDVNVFYSVPATPINKRSLDTTGAATTQPLRRSLRPRTSRINFDISPKRNYTKKRPPPVQDAATNLVQKKLKLDGKRALTVAVNDKRSARDDARKRWLFCHRELFEPLLPPSNNLFQNLQKDIALQSDIKSGGIAYVPLHELDQQPTLVEGGEMKDYQLHGLSYLVWMYMNGMNCILGDEMGLGKTLQTLSLFAWIKENIAGKHDPHLVICPLSVLAAWQTEAARWLPSLRTVRFHGTANERERLKNSMRGSVDCDIMITTYDVYVTEDAWFKSHRWTYCVLDEGHKIKNAETNLAHKVQGLGSLYRLVLTGTPVQNDLVELWGLLHWLYPSVFTPPTETLFKDSFDITRGSYTLPFLSAAKKLVATLMLRRTKAVVEIDVPPREESTIFVPLTEAQRFWTYRLLTMMDAPNLAEVFQEKLELGDTTVSEGRQEVLSHLENQIEESKNHKGRAGKKDLSHIALSDVASEWTKLMNLLMQLRKVCDHPYLLPNAEPNPYHLGEHIVAASSKLITIDKILADILPKGERVLIFSQWTGMLDLLEDFLNLRSIPYARLDGSTHRPRRALDIRLFQQEVSPYKVFLISTKAGGLGINLTKASTVIMCDSDWNPQNDLQAIARAHRIGQTKIVQVYRLICRGSVEDQMLDRIRRKLFLSMKIMGSENPTSEDSSSLGSQELMDILRKGSSALAESGQGMQLEQFLNADISEILKESKSCSDVRDTRLKRDLKLESPDDEATPDLLLDAEAEEQKLLSGIAQVRCRLFEGKLVQRCRTVKEIADEWQGLQKRARVNRTVVVGGMTFLLPPPTNTTVAATGKAPETRKRAKFESEDWCIHCHDGGELVLCQHCPRVFHPKCRGLSKAECKRIVSCEQHSCAICFRSTSDAGGMLFRCRTCPQAFCEDCLPPGELDAIGDSLPELYLLGYGAKPNAYYIRCDDCCQHFSSNPDLWEEWQADLRATLKTLRDRYKAQRLE
ncbi:P-loop containing nucleoside triphosphate hydrolase protein [Infundibulicybe gibba]|nr:P-loop containing nucleoside triphosphate hydrolase protein [Infundibulicybe gibba]